MIKLTDLSKISEDPAVESLLAQRKAPLSQEGFYAVLQDLTINFARADTAFAGTAFPKKDHENEEVITAADIDRLDIMEDVEGNRYLPLFTTMAHLDHYKPQRAENEYVYLFVKEDIQLFLERNAKVAAAVVNPGVDDLLLTRQQIRNLLKLQEDFSGK